jgi:hypothetical protein
MMHGANDIQDMESSKARLMDLCASNLPASEKAWLKEALHKVANSGQVNHDLGLYSAMARRKLGVDCLQQATTLDTRQATLDIHRWSNAETGRLILLMTAIEERPGEAQSIISSYYQTGDESERMALLRGLILFAPAAYLSEIALDAGRTNNLEVLAALTLDNPYPACFFNDDQFNQMVLKALFLGLAIERVDGLAKRANPELARMGENYVVEREQAKRSVPVDVWLAIAPCASATGRQQMIDYLGHDDIGHRYYCSLGLIQRLPQDPSLLPILRQRLDTERETLILDLLRNTLETRQ